MNQSEESPFECPICYENYNKTICIPTSFQCGHSCCLSHLSILQLCPICRAQISKQQDCKPNYSLRDGAILYFELLYKTNNKITPKKTPVTESFDTKLSPSPIPDLSNIELSDEEYAKLLDTELNGSPPPSPKKSQPLRSSLKLPPPPPPPVLTRKRSTEGVMKSCGHRCNLFYDMCCSCSDGRPVGENYPTYIDDIGWMDIGDRSDGYCCVCKDRP